MPQISYTLILTTIGQFNLYGQSLMLTAGGPNNSTYTMMMYIRELAFGSSSVARMQFLLSDQGLFVTFSAQIVL